MASSVSRFTVNPKTCIRKTAPISEIGIAMIGIIVERHEPRKRKMTTQTISSVSARVWKTSLIAVLM